MRKYLLNASIQKFQLYFSLFYARKVYRVIPYSQSGKGIPIVHSLMERVIDHCHFLTLPFFLNGKNKNHAAIAQVPCIPFLMR